MAHKNKYATIRIREDLHYALTAVALKNSKGQSKLTSKAKVLEEILKDFFQIKDEIHKKSLVS